MNSKGGISYSNAAVAVCPKHLLQFAVDQRYDDYTSVDHAVWRFIMRQNIFFLKEYAHKVYFQGLLNTGISFERIPRIEEMNDILAKIEWGAVAVDGFIPPAAFMEFQAYKVLVIACDRSCADYCRPGILKLFAALWRNRSESDVVQERFRAVSSDPALIDPERTAER